MSDDADRDAILARRARFIASALAGLALTTAASCDGDVARDPEAAQGSATGTGGEGGAQPCLKTVGSGGGTGGEPRPCLSTGGHPPTGGEGGVGFGGLADVGGMAGAAGRPEPCLAPKR